MATKESRAAVRPAQVSEDLLYDVRLVERYISRGVLDRETYHKRCRESPDMADHSQPLVSDAARPPAAKS